MYRRMFESDELLEQFKLLLFYPFITFFCWIWVHYKILLKFFIFRAISVFKDNWGPQWYILFTYSIGNLNGFFDGIVYGY